jgi:hypothetical protein
MYYRRWLLRDVLNFLSLKYGGMMGRLGEPRWQSRARLGPDRELQPRLHCKAMHEIIRRATDNDRNCTISTFRSIIACKLATG